MADVCIGMVLSASLTVPQDAIECILGQCGVDLEIFLAVPDETQSFPLKSDPRVRLLKQSRLPTPFELLELMASESTATFLLCLDPRQHLLPDTLSTFLADMQNNEGIEMTYSLQFCADEAGQVSRAAYHRQWEQARKLQGFDGRRLEDFLDLEFLPDNIRIYRRQALSSKVFCRSKRYSTRGFIWSAHCLLNAKLKSEPICISHGTLTVTAPKSFDIRDYLGRVKALMQYRAHLRTGFGCGEVLLGALWHFCLNGPVVDAWNRGRSNIRRWRVRTGLSDMVYWFLVRLFRRWPPPRLRAPSNARSNPGRKIGYYIWQFPVRSQTFVQREVAALLKAGQDVVVITEIAPEHDFISELRSRLAGSVINAAERAMTDDRPLKWRMFFSTPFRYLGLNLFVLGRRYHPGKSRRFDKEVFRTALRLASLVEERGVSHLHSPWADNCAFVGLIAARLLGIPFSLQARAHDVHRQDYRFALEEKFINAEFIITNTRYNVGRIQSIIGDEHAGKIHLIYNGLNIRQFQPTKGPHTKNGEARLLCVARLIDQKGLTYLLQACRQLIDGGVKLRCDIVGGYEDVFMNYYIELKRMHQRLQLEDTVYFTGPLPFEEVLIYYGNADVFVLPCVIAEDGSRDITPNAVLEAMAMQLPVVATNVTGLPELVDHGQSGFLVPPHDVEALVSAIEKLIRSADLRTEFGLAARKKVERQFDSDINAAQYQALFENQGKPSIPCS